MSDIIYREIRNDAGMYREWLKNLLRDAPRGTKARLSEKLRIDPTMISKMISGTRDISAEELRGIADFFKAMPPGLPTQSSYDARLNRVKIRRPDLAAAAEGAIEGALRSIEERDEEATQ